jgi:nitrate reductase gamma subunit
MESLLEFSKGPLFRLCFSIMILGLIRILFIDIRGAVIAYRKAGDKTMPWNLIFRRSLEWIFPIKRLGRNRPLYSILSVLFHIGLLITPIFLFAHIQLWKEGIGISWPALSYNWAYFLTSLTIISGAALFFGRVFSKSSSFLSRKQDYFWPLLLLIPFVTGYLCAHMNVNPKFYQVFMLIHILSGNLIFILIPFTKIAHCVLMPLSQVICILAWKFPPDTDDVVCTTLNKKGDPV